MLEKILDFSIFWENFQKLNLPPFIKKGMVSIMLYLFEKLKPPTFYKERNGFNHALSL